jgi:protein-S-isoprenylcysteine O-methyltransferase Ste14
MSWIPVFKIGLWNAWLFMIIYPLQWLAVIILPKHIAERTGHADEIIRNRKDRVLATLTQVFWIGATLYSIFLPFRTGTIWFWVGLGLFVIGVTVLVLASVNVASTPPVEPFSKGVYRFSRHPMYLSMLIVYLAVCLAALSWLFALITIITFFLQRQQSIREEGYCLKTYGKAYRDYMERTARWFGIPKK